MAEGDIKVQGNFEINVGKPIDSRSQVADLGERNLIPALKRWEGMTVYVAQIAKTYQLIGGLDNSKWVEVGAVPDTDLPDQTGHAGEFLTTDGTTTSWASFEALANIDGGSPESIYLINQNIDGGAL